MLHRVIYEVTKGPIPEGHEVDHMCKNRACCNPKHLQALEGREHTIEGNRNRYAARLAEAKELWANDNATAPQLAERFGVSQTASYKWIRDWKKAA